jgi:hypothetical protein
MLMHLMHLLVDMRDRLLRLESIAAIKSNQIKYWNSLYFAASPIALATA